MTGDDYNYDDDDDDSTDVNNNETKSRLDSETDPTASSSFYSSNPSSVTKFIKSSTSTHNLKKGALSNSKPLITGSHTSITGSQNLTTTNNASYAASNTNIQACAGGVDYSSSSSSNHGTSRLSISIEKFNVNFLKSGSSTSATTNTSIIEQKRKSQSDLLSIRNGGLSSSMYNMSRSCSLNCNELDGLDLKKMTMVNKSQLNGLLICFEHFFLFLFLLFSHGQAQA